jgi:hypothetical protein
MKLLPFDRSPARTTDWLVVAVWIACLPSLRATAQLPTIEIATVQPSVVQIGSSFELRFGGNRLEELSHVTFTPCNASRAGASRAGASQQSEIDERPLSITTTPKMREHRLLDDVPVPSSSFQVTVDGSTAPGLIDTRVLGRFGISNPRRMLLAHKPVVKPNDGHTDRGNAYPLPLEAIVSSTCVPQQRNFYSLSLMAGQTLRCAVYSQPLDSRAAIALTLIDDREQELAQARSMHNWPAEIEYLAKQDVQLYLVVHDRLYQGGDEFSYALEAVAAPPAPSTTDPSEVTAAQLELNTLLRPSSIRSPIEGATPAQAAEQPLKPGFIVEGSLASEPFTVDFGADAQPLEVTVSSHELDSLTDPTLVIYQVEPATAEAPARLNQVAQQDDDTPIGRPDVRLRRLDPRLLWTPPAEGIYRAQVLDQQAGDRPDDAVFFRLSVSPAQPTFSLVAYQPFPNNNPATARGFGSNLLRGGSESIHVIVLRHAGFEGAVTLQVEGLPASISCPPAVVPPSAQDGELILISSEDSPAWHGPIRVTGHATLGEQQLVVPAKYATVQWSASATRNAVQHRPSADLWLASNASDVAPLSVRLGPSATPTEADEQTDTTTTSALTAAPTLEVRQGEKLSIPIALLRRPGGQAECTLRPQHLAKGVTSGEIKIAADQSEGNAELTAAGDAPLGEFTMWMQVETVIKFRPNPQALEREEAYLATLTAAVEGTTVEDEKTRLNAAMEAATSRVEELKKQTAEQDFTVWLPSTPQTVRVLPAAN